MSLLTKIFEAPENTVYNNQYIYIYIYINVSAQHCIQ